MNIDLIKKLILQKPSDYQIAKKISAEIDSLLGFDIANTEKKLLSIKTDSQQVWTHVSSDVFQTPYSEFAEMIDIIQPQAGDLWVDFGAAYGRLGITLGLLRSDVKFKGYEIMQARVSQANEIYQKWQLNAAEVIATDLSLEDFELPEASCYFIYDFGTKSAVTNILNKLKNKSLHKPITVIGRGRGIRNWIAQEHPWLGYVVPPIHKEHWSIYRS